MINFTSHILENIRLTVRYYKSIYELSLLTPKELKELGLTYAEIHTTVYTAMLKEMNSNDKCMAQTI